MIRFASVGVVPAYLGLGSQWNEFVICTRLDVERDANGKLVPLVGNSAFAAILNRNGKALRAAGAERRSIAASGNGGSDRQGLGLK